MRLSWDISDALTLVSITDYRHDKNDYFEGVDGTADNAVVDAIVGFGTGSITIPVDLGATADTVYQEFRLSGGSDSLTWFAGLSYYYEDLDTDKYQVDYVDTALGLGTLASTRIVNEAENNSYGVYAEATWNVTEKLALIGGARWSYDDKDWCSNTLQDDTLEAGGPTDGKLCTDENWDEFTPRLVAQYDLSDDVMAFASVSKGYKGCGFNNSAADTNGDFMGDTIVPFDPETSIAYELGLKSTTLDGKMQLNGSVFYSEYDDFLDSNSDAWNWPAGRQWRGC
jgi:iron complex outermembrane receptor protein